MRIRAITAAVSISVILVAGCATPPNKEQTGMLIGGALGGILGSHIGGGSGRTAAIIVGTLAGAAIGGSVGHSMDETDRLKAASTLETVRTGVSSEWRNPDTGNEFMMTPTRTYQTSEGPCREYTMDATIGGNTEQVHGKACRQADGSWKV